MKKIKISLIVSACAALIACNSGQEPSHKTGQEDGLNTIDSTKNQTSDTTAPGYHSSSSNPVPPEPTPGSPETGNEDPGSGNNNQ